MGAEHGRLRFGAILLLTLIAGCIPSAHAKPLCKVTNCTIVWNMASHAILSTSSIIGDTRPYAGLKYIAPKQQPFDDDAVKTYTYSGTYAQGLPLNLQSFQSSLKRRAVTDLFFKI